MCINYQYITNQHGGSDTAMRDSSGVCRGASCGTSSVRRRSALPGALRGGGASSGRQDSSRGHRGRRIRRCRGCASATGWPGGRGDRAAAPAVPPPAHQHGLTSRMTMRVMERAGAVASPSPSICTANADQVTIGSACHTGMRCTAVCAVRRLDEQSARPDDEWSYS